jgi:hypothetical protein
MNLGKILVELLLHLLLSLVLLLLEVRTLADFSDHPLDLILASINKCWPQVYALRYWSSFLYFRS